MLFQYISDLHLDHCRTSQQLQERLTAIKPIAPYLIVAGDIADPYFGNEYDQFLDQVSKDFKEVWIIAGNHEYYANNKRMCKSRLDVNKETDWMKLINKRLEEKCQKRGNITFLNNSCSNICKNLQIYGGTMWTHIAKEEIVPVTESINDYNYIPDFCIKKGSQLHDEFVQNLSKQLDDPTNERILVVSHHIPSFDFIHPIYRSGNINSAFAMEVPLKNHPKVIGWVFGHTHKEFTKGSFYCNPLGYPNEFSPRDPNRVFEIPY